MPTYTGLTIGDYAVTPGLAAGTYTATYESLFVTYVAEILTGQKSYSNRLTAQAGIAAVTRGGFNAILSPQLATAIQTTNIIDLATKHHERKLAAAKLAEDLVKVQEQSEELLQKDNDKLAELTVQVNKIAHKIAEKDRERVDKTTQQGTEQVWKAAESLLDRGDGASNDGAKLDLAQDQWAWITAQDVLDRDVKTDALMETLKIAYVNLASLNADDLSNDGTQTLTLKNRYTPPYPLWRLVGGVGELFDHSGNIMP